MAGAAAPPGKVEASARWAERQNLFTLGQGLKQMIFRFVSGARTTTLKAEHTLELALAEVA